VARTRAETGHTRPLATVFGQVTVTRIAYRAPGAPNVHPADAALNLPEEKHSHGLGKLAAAADIGALYAARRPGPALDDQLLVLTCGAALRNGAAGAVGMCCRARLGAQDRLVWLRGRPAREELQRSDTPAGADSQTRRRHWRTSCGDRCRSPAPGGPGEGPPV
jgi:hypothetical protein